MHRKNKKLKHAEKEKIKEILRNKKHESKKNIIREETKDNK